MLGTYCKEQPDLLGWRQGEGGIARLIVSQNSQCKRLQSAGLETTFPSIALDTTVQHKIHETI